MIDDMVCICPTHGETTIGMILPPKMVKLACGCEFIQREKGKFSPPRRQKSSEEKLALIEKSYASKKPLPWCKDITGVSWQTLLRWQRLHEKDPASIEPKNIGRPRKSRAETKPTNKGN